MANSKFRTIKGKSGSVTLVRKGSPSDKRIMKGQNPSRSNRILKDAQRAIDRAKKNSRKK